MAYYSSPGIPEYYMNEGAPSMAGSGIGGGIKGAGMGASFGGLPGAIAGGIIGGIGGLFGAKGKRAALRRQAELRAKLARLDTEYSPLVNMRSQINPEEYGQVNSGLMGGLGGAASGAMQGYNIYRGFQKDKENEEKMKLLRQLAGSGQDLTMQGAGQAVAPVLDSGNVYSNLGLESLFA